MAVPTYSHTTPLANQVAGHNNLLSDASAVLVIKPAVPREIAFYQLINSASKRSALAGLKPFVPTFYGTLRLEGQLDGETINPEGVKDIPESVVLENITHLYTHPSIQDIKLGTNLHSPSAPPAKRLKMETQARNTTSYSTGLRLTGCQTWYSPLQRYILTPKSFGKGLREEDLGRGLRRFFPVKGEEVEELFGWSHGAASSGDGSTEGSTTGLGLDGIKARGTQDPTQDLEGYITAPGVKKTSTTEPMYLSPGPKSAGESTSGPSRILQSEKAEPINTPITASSTSQPSSTPLTSSTFSSNPTTASTSTPPSTIATQPTTPHTSRTPIKRTTYKDHQIPPNLTVKLLMILEQKLNHLISVIETLEMRFVGSSVLIVYEGDEVMLGERFERHEGLHPSFAEPGEGSTPSSFSRPQPATSDYHDDNAPSDYDSASDEEIDSEEDSNSNSDSDSDSLNGPKKDSKRIGRLPPLQVKMIDFAHTRLAQGEGADEGVLLGLRNLVKLVIARRGEVESIARAAWSGDGRGTLPDAMEDGLDRET